MKYRSTKLCAFVMSVLALALALAATPAKAEALSSDSADSSEAAVSSEGCYVQYSYGSLQVVYVSDARSTDSLSNAVSTFESATTVATDSGSVYNGSYGDVTRASVDVEGESDSFAVDDLASAHAPGWAYEDGAYRYYEPDGTMRVNAWVSVDGAWNYLGEDGTLVTNAWIEDNDARYYVGEDGTPLTDCWLTYADARYYLGADGKLLASSWLSYADEWYYLGSDGHMLAGEQLEEGGLYYYFDADGTLLTSSTSSATGSLAAVTSACYSTPSTGSGGCAAWVSNVFANAGIGSWHGNACDFYWSWCTSSDLADLKPGMIIAVSSCAGTSASRAYGHVGIYLGNGIVMQNLLGSVGTMSLDTWLDYFDGYSTPAWGWLGGVVLV